MEPVVAPRTYSGRYEVTHLIARGGMAQVYRALDTRLGRHVALKVLFPELSVDRTFVERFRREAQAAANLSHPNIVAVYDWGGEDDGAYFIAMELITGSSLATALRAERTFPATRAAAIAAQVAAALSYAHRNGVVHRDIKPGNVLLTDDGGQVKVTDFGIAQAVSTEEGLTMAGSVMGTAAYFSPEQAEGAVVDGRSDLYSLGVVLYEMLAGRPPFVGDSPVAVASMHVRNDPPLLRDLNPAVPEALEQVTMRALAKSPDARYQTADEMREDLQRFVEGRPVLAGAAVAGASVGTTSVMGAAPSTSALPPSDTTRVVPVVAPDDALPPPPPPRVPDESDGDDGMDGAAPARSGAPPAAWIGIVLAIALVLVGFLAYRVLTGPSGLTVPNVVGEQQVQAAQTLQGLGLSVVKYIPRTSPKPVGTVLGVSPPVGHSIRAGGHVVLVTSSGPAKPVTVPPVVGLSELNANSQLAMVGLKVRISRVTSWNEPVVAGTVLQQAPLGDTTANSGTYVTLTLLTPTGTFPVPSLTDDTQVQAGAALARYDLNPGSTMSTCSSSVAQGNVVSTNPGAGASVTAGDTVNLTVSSGQCPVKVPYVIGLPIATAKQMILGAQLQPVVAQCPQGGTSDGTVAKETPAWGTPVVPGSTVTLTPGCTTGPTGPTGPTGATGATAAHGPGASRARGDVARTVSGARRRSSRGRAAPRR